MRHNAASRACAESRSNGCPDQFAVWAIAGLAMGYELCRASIFHKLFEYDDRLLHDLMDHQARQDNPRSRV